MNPLTLVKRIQQINKKEASLGISDDASWHAKYKDSAYVFVGGIPFDLTEGDLLAVFAQYGEIVDVNLVRDKGTGKSKGFAFVAYEDQRSTNLAVDNLNGAQVLGRTVRVDHCSKYKKKEEEDEETQRQKREARGVCRAFQKGECTRGDSCKFSHDEQRAANTGWGAEEDRQSRWGHDKFDGTRRNDRQSSQVGRIPQSVNKEDNRAIEKKESRGKDHGRLRDGPHEHSDNRSRDQDRRDIEKRSEKEKEMNSKREQDRSYAADRNRRRHDDGQLSREDREKRDERSFRLHESESNYKEERESRKGPKRLGYERDSSPHRRKTNGDEKLPREDHDKRDEKRIRTYEFDSYRRDDRERRGADKRSDYDKDSSQHHRRTDEDRGHRSRK